MTKSVRRLLLVAAGSLMALAGGERVQAAEAHPHCSRDNRGLICEGITVCKGTEHWMCYTYYTYLPE